jgi:hypothetical protein
VRDIGLFGIPDQRVASNGNCRQFAFALLQGYRSNRAA